MFPVRLFWTRKTTDSWFCQRVAFFETFTLTPILAAVCKRMQQLPTILGFVVHRGKDTTQKTLETMCARQCWKSWANRSNIIALRFGDHGTKEMLGVVGSNVWLVSNFAQQLPTTRNNMQWPTMLRSFVRGFTLATIWGTGSKSGRNCSNAG